MRVFSRFSDGHCGWFRIFGFGLSWKNTDTVDLLFSERVLKRGFQVGKYRVHFLKP
jgi:hypothetical protein